MSDVTTKAIEAWIESNALHDEYRELMLGKERKVVMVLAELRRSHPELVEQIVAKHGLRIVWDYADYLLDRASDLPT